MRRKKFTPQGSMMKFPHLQNILNLGYDPKNQLNCVKGIACMRRQFVDFDIPDCQFQLSQPSRIGKCM